MNIKSLPLGQFVRYKNKPWTPGAGKPGFVPFLKKATLPDWKQYIEDNNIQVQIYSFTEAGVSYTVRYVLGEVTLEEMTP